MNIKVVKVVGTCLTLAGVIINLASNSINEKILDNRIETKVQNAISKQNQTNIE